MTSPSPLQPTIRMIRPIFAGLMQSGHDALEVLVRAGIDPLQVAEGKARVPARVVAQAFELAAEVSGPDFGLHTARLIDFAAAAQLSGSSEYLMLEVMAQQRTVRESLANLARYSGVGFGAGGFVVAEQGRGIRVTFELEHGVRSPRAAADYMAGMALRSLRQWTGHALPSARVRFRHAAPAELALYEEVLGHRPVFGAEVNELKLDEADAERLLSTYQPKLARAVAERADAELARLGAPRSVADEVRHALSHAPPGREYSAADVAKDLAVSLRTLRRKLLAEGVTYQALVDEHRARLALEWLRDESLSVAEVASRLGFAGQSAFHRAFRRWYGLAPSEVRAGREPRFRGKP